MQQKRFPTGGLALGAYLPRVDEHHQLSGGDWDAIANEPAFKALIAAKLRFVVPATIFFMLFFFALPVSLAMAPQTMARAILGPLTVADVFALAEFAMAWILLALYLLRARSFDAAALKIVERERTRPEA